MTGDKYIWPIHLFVAFKLKRVSDKQNIYVDTFIKRQRYTYKSLLIVISYDASKTSDQPIYDHHNYYTLYA